MHIEVYPENICVYNLFKLFLRIIYRIYWKDGKCLYCFSLCARVMAAYSGKKDSVFLCTQYEEHSADRELFPSCFYLRNLNNYPVREKYISYIKITKIVKSVRKFILISLYIPYIMYIMSHPLL